MSCCSNKPYYWADPCPNCGQEDEYEREKGARMGSSAWNHHYMCCSEKCGLEFAEKLKLSPKLAIIRYLTQLIRKLDNEIKQGEL